MGFEKNLTPKIMYSPETGYGEDVIPLKGRRVFGSEHVSHINIEEGRVDKTKHVFGDVWQTNEAERDLKAMQESGVDVVPTDILHNALVRNGGEARERVTYVLRQPYLASHPLTYADLYHNTDFQRQLLDFFLKGQEIRVRHDLGFDLLGGQILKMVGPIINPFEDSINPEVSNLLVPDTDVVAKINLPKSGVKEGDVIARKGQIKQCDTRMYDFDRRGVRGRLIKAILLKMQDAQDSALSSLLASFNFKTKFDTEKTRIRRMVKTLLERALPKMRAAAEAMGPQYSPQMA